MEKDRMENLDGLPLVAWISLKKKNKQVGHALAMGEVVMDQKNGSKNNIKVKKKISRVTVPTFIT